MQPPINVRILTISKVLFSRSQRIPKRNVIKIEKTAWITKRIYSLTGSIIFFVYPRKSKDQHLLGKKQQQQYELSYF